MKQALVVLMAVFAGAGLWAQEQKTDKPEAVEAARAQQSVIRIYQVNPDSIDRISKTLSSLFLGSAQVNSQANVLIVRTTADLAPAIDTIVEKLKTAPPPKNIEMTFYILQGSRDPAVDGTPLPQELEPVVKQLKATFAYQGFRLLDTALMRGRSGQRADLQGVASIEKDSSSLYSIRATWATSSEAKPQIIRIDDLRLNIRVPVHSRPNSTGEYWDTGFTANLDFKEGQKVVVGKSGIEGGQSALIVVATGKVID
jgi:hypothetical protein